MRFGTALIAIAMVALCGCAGGSGAPGGAARLADTPGGLADTLGVSFELLPESMLAGGTVELVPHATGAAADGLTAGTDASSLTLELRGSQLSGLKALYGRLRYDPAVWAPGELRPAACWGSGDKLLSLAVEREPGVLDVGIVLTQWDKCAGLSGSMELASVALAMADGARRISTRQVSALDIGETFSVFAGLDRHTQEVTWQPDFPGDYDQNGEVNISDLTPLANHIGEAVNYSNSIQVVLDGDGNNEINIGDITPIGQHYSQKLSWAIYYGSVLTTGANGLVYPTLPKCSLVTYTDYASRQGNPATERVHFSVQLSELEPGPFYALAPVINSTLAGTSGWIFETSAHPVRYYINNPCYALAWDAGNSLLTFQWILHGDGNENGRVDISDLTPLGANFGSSGQFPPGSREWLVDYDKNGQIGLSDIAVLEMCSSATLDGYLFYSATDQLQLPADYSYADSAPVAQRTPLGDGDWGNLSFASGAYVWLRPYVGDPTDIVNIGAPSEVIQIP